MINNNSNNSINSNYYGSIYLFSLIFGCLTDRRENKVLTVTVHQKDKKYVTKIVRNSVPLASKLEIYL